MSNVDSALAGSYEPAAIYYGDSDCLEYVKADDFCLYERVDEFLTLVRGIDGETLIGFKLKGFRNRFDRLVGLTSLGDDEFLHIMRAIENICTEIGQNLTRDANRRAAYKAAYDLAANDNVRVSTRELKEAA